MNGLVSTSPSQASVRLALGGFLLLLVQNALLLMGLLMGLGLDANARMLLWVLTPIAASARVVALAGSPEPDSDPWRRRHVR